MAEYTLARYPRQLERHKQISLHCPNMCIQPDALSYAGQASSAGVDLGIAVSTRKGGTPSRGTLQMSLWTGSSTPLEKGSSRPASRGAPLPKSRKGTEPNADSVSPQKGAKGSGAQGWSSSIMGINCSLEVTCQKGGMLCARLKCLGHWSAPLPTN